MADLAARDLRSPDGEIEDWLFPELSSEALNERLDVYLVEAYAKSGVAGLGEPQRHDAARAWAYHRAYMAVYIRLSSSPASMSLTDQGSASYNADQIANVRDLAERWQAIFLRLVPAATLTVAVETLPPSGAVETMIGW